MRIQQTAQNGFGVGGIEVFGRLVEQHDRRRRDDRPRQQQPPALPGRHRLRAADQHRVQTIGQAGQPRVQPDPVQRGGQILRLGQSPRATSRLSRTVVAKICASSAKKLTALRNSGSLSELNGFRPT